VSLIIVGQSTRSWWHRLRHGSIVSRFVNNTAGLDVHVVSFTETNVRRPRDG
jgi:K+-sensing histidine kinase KdpD